MLIAINCQELNSPTQLTGTPQLIVGGPVQFSTRYITCLRPPNLPIIHGLMEYLKKNILNSQNTNLRLEEEAIQTLSNRLQHATLSADRRSAVLGLKSFSRQFRESVVEYGLRPLLLTLEKDSGTLPTVKAVMETLIILFIRGGTEDNEALGWISNQSRIQNGKYPSPSLMANLEMDQFSMWIADEVISCDDYIKAMVDTLHSSQDFHIRLYTLQFLEALVATRATRTKECLINIPLAVSTIVSLLNDPNDPVRNEAILLLMALVRDNFNIQKLVAFENTFDRLFEIIEEEGGIRGSILVQDCLTLLTNLLMYNASNQKFFLETDCVPKLARLLAEPIESSPADTNPDEDPLFAAAPIVWTEQRLQNMSIALEICKSFVDKDNQLREQNQNRLYQAGIFFSIMRLTFSHLTEIPIRKTALEITGDLIASNKDLQYEFSRIDVPYIDPSLPIQIQRYDKPIPAPLALLNWCLLSNSVHTFEIRLSSVYCLQCLFVDNNEAKVAFLTDQIKSNQNPNFYNELEKPEEDDATANQEDANTMDAGDENLAATPYANIFSTLTNFDFEVKLNPYRVWFASIILIYLFEECPENKEAAQEVTIGNSEDGEEVMTCIQAISEILMTSLENSDPRIAIGLLLLLTVWLFEDFDAVNDFLGDPAIIKTLLGFLSKNSSDSSTLVHGMSAILVGTAYEFSTKSSPIPRSELYSIITKALGADNYSLKVKQFRDCEEFKHFTDPLTAGFEKDSTGLPKVYFIENYLELIKDNFHRIRKALSRDPLIEPQLRISYEAFEELEGKYATLVRDMCNLKTKSEENEKYLRLKVSEAEKELEISNALLRNSSSHLETIRELESVLTSKIENLTKEIKFMESEKLKFEASSNKLAEELERSTKSSSANETLVKNLKQKLENVEAEKSKAEGGINKMSRELFQLTKQQKESNFTISTLEKKIVSIEASKTKLISDYEIQLDGLRRANDNYKAKVKILETQLKELSDDRDRKAFKIREFQERLSEAESNNSNLLEKLRTAAALVQHLRKANPDMKEDKAMILAAILQSQEESKATRELESDILKHQEKIRELEFLMLQAKNSAAEVEKNLRDEISALTSERDKHAYLERALKSEIDKLQSDFEEQIKQSTKEKISLEEQVQLLEEEKHSLTEKISRVESEMKEEKNQLEMELENLRKEAIEKQGILSESLEEKTSELNRLETKHKEELEASLTLQKQLDKQIEKFNELSKKSLLDKDAFVKENEDLLLQINNYKLQLEISMKESKSIISSLEARIKELQLEIENSAVLEKEKELHRETQLQKEFQEKEAEINKLKEEVKKLVDARESLASETQFQFSELSEDNKKTLDDLTSQIDKLRVENNDLSEKLTKALEEKNLTFSTERQLLINSIESEKQNLESIFLKLENTSKLLKEYEEVIENKTKEIEHQAKLIEKQNEDHKQMERLTEDLKLESQKEKEIMQLKFDDLEKSKAALDEELNSLNMQKHGLEVDLARAKEAKLSLELELQDAQESKLSIENELAAKVTLIEELESSIKSERDMRSQEEFLMKVESHDHDDITKEALTKEVTNKISELVAKDQLIREIKRKLEESTIALEDLTEKNENLVKENKHSNEEMKKVLNELNSSQKSVKQLEKKLSKTTRSAGGDNNQDLEDYKERISELEHSLEKNDQRYQMTIEELESSNNLKLSSLEADIENLNNKSDALINEKNQLETENEKIRLNCEELQSALSSIETDLKEIEKELTETKEEYLIKAEKAKSLEDSIKVREVEWHTTNIQLQEEAREMKNACEELESQIESLQSALNAKEIEFNDALSRISSFEDTLDHKNESLSNAHETLSENSKEIRNMKSILEDREREIRQLKDKLEESVIDDDETKKRLSITKDEFETYKKESEKELEALKHELENNRTTYDLLQKECSTILEKYEKTLLQLNSERDASAKIDQKLRQFQISHEQYVLERDEELKQIKEQLHAERDSFKEEIEKKEEEISRLSHEQETWKEKMAKEEKVKNDHIETEKQMQNDLNSHLEKIATLEKKMSDLVKCQLTLEKEKNEAQSRADGDEQKLQVLQSQIDNLQLEVSCQSETIISASKEAEALKSDLQRASQSLKESEEKHTTAEATMSEQLDKAHEKISLSEKLSDRLEELEKQLADSQKKLEQEESSRLHAESTARKLESECSGHATQVADLKKELAAKIKLEADFEDLMLLWEEQEKKIEKYKQRLRDINQPISSDEEA